MLEPLTGYRAALYEASIQSHGEDLELESLSSQPLDEISIISRNSSRSTTWSAGLKSLLMLASGFVVLASVAGYLTFLWFGEGYGRSWSRIVLANWATTSIAMCSVIVRTTVTIQVAFTTSILALALLSRGTSISQIPRISGLRYSNSGPLELLYLLVHPCKLVNTFPILLITSLAAITTVLLQFTSTFLVSDLDIGAVETPVNQTNNPVLVMDNENFNYSAEYWTAPE